MVIIIWSIASLSASATPLISHSTFCQAPELVILGVVSVVVPPESCIPILILLPVLELYISK